MYRRKWGQGVYPSTTYLAVVFLLVIMFISGVYFLALNEPDSSPQQADIQEELRSNREAWETRQPKSFRYVVDRSCNCPIEIDEPYLATEQDGDRSAEYRSHVSAQSRNDLSTPPEPVWIDDLFRIAEQGVLDGDSVRVDFNSRYGYPTLVRITRVHGMSEIESQYEIRDFEVLEYE